MMGEAHLIGLLPPRFDNAKTRTMSLCNEACAVQRYGVQVKSGRGEGPVEKVEGRLRADGMGVIESHAPSPH